MHLNLVRTETGGCPQCCRNCKQSDHSAKPSVVDGDEDPFLDNDGEEFCVEMEADKTTIDNE